MTLKNGQSALGQLIIADPMSDELKASMRAAIAQTGAADADMLADMLGVAA